MQILLLISGGLAAVFVGRILLKQWFNHLSVYSAMWTISLVLYAFRLIQYNSISTEAWFYIVMAWLALYLGSITAFCARLASRHTFSYTLVAKRAHRDQQRVLSIDSKLLAKTVVILSMIAALSIIYQWVENIKYFGGIRAVIVNANLLYQLRVSGEFHGIPYLGHFALAACCLAGIYTAVRGKLSLVSILPLLLVGLQGIAVMGRATIVIAGILFFTTFLYTPGPKHSKIRVLSKIVLVGVVIVGMFVLVSSKRGLVVRFEYEAPIMETLRTHISFLPSIYFYLSAPPVVLSEFLKAGAEEIFSGNYTFRILFNVLSKFDFVDRPPTYTSFYFTPEPMNTGTYLRYLYADFGPVGILLFPYILGIVLTILHFKINKRPTLTRLVLLAHFYVIIFLSWGFYPLCLGYWWVSLLTCLFVSVTFCCLKQLRCNNIVDEDVCCIKS